MSNLNLMSLTDRVEHLEDVYYEIYRNINSIKPNYLNNEAYQQYVKFFIEDTTEEIFRQLEPIKVSIVEKILNREESIKKSIRAEISGFLENVINELQKTEVFNNVMKELDVSLHYYDYIYSGKKEYTSENYSRFFEESNQNIDVFAHSSKEISKVNFKENFLTEAYLAKLGFYKNFDKFKQGVDSKSYKKIAKSFNNFFERELNQNLTRETPVTTKLVNNLEKIIKKESVSYAFSKVAPSLFLSNDFQGKMMEIIPNGELHIGIQDKINCWNDQLDGLKRDDYLLYAGLVVYLDVELYKNNDIKVRCSKLRKEMINSFTLKDINNYWREKDPAICFNLMNFLLGEKEGKFEKISEFFKVDDVKSLFDDKVGRLQSPIQNKYDIWKDELLRYFKEQQIQKNREMLGSYPLSFLKEDCVIRNLSFNINKVQELFNEEIYVSSDEFVKQVTDNVKIIIMNDVINVEMRHDRILEASQEDLIQLSILAIRALMDEKLLETFKNEERNLFLNLDLKANDIESNRTKKNSTGKPKI